MWKRATGNNKPGEDSGIEYVEKNCYVHHPRNVCPRSLNLSPGKSTPENFTGCLTFRIAEKLKRNAVNLLRSCQDMLTI